MLRFSKKDRQDDFLELMHQHQGILIKVCRVYTNSKDDYDDLYQEILIQAWQAFPNFKGLSKFSTWLYKVSLNIALTTKRKQNKGSDRVDIHEVNAGSSEMEKEYDTKDLIQQAVMHLNDAEKAILVLMLEGYSYQEIASLIGISINHVGVKINRIKNKLKEVLIDIEI